MKIIFIIPTLGRQSLINTIQSLINLTSNDWKALIIFDGIQNNLDQIYINKINKNQQFIFLEINKCGIINENKINNCAGFVRNYGIEYLLNHEKEELKTEYIGFLDDDDTLHPNYIDYLKKEELKFQFDIIIFRMMYKNFNIIPHLLTKKIEKKNVGISFAFKYEIIKNNKDLRFKNDCFEDFIFIFIAKQLNIKILLSKYIAYFVQTNYNQCANYITTYIKNLPHVYF
jgi:hypothetical protein